MINRLLPLVLLLSPMLYVGCQSVPRLVEYDNNQINKSTAQFPGAVPIILVGKIAEYSEIGGTHPSRLDAEIPMQLCRITVRVENVLRGDVALGDSPIFFFVNFGSNGGPARLGMLGRGGRWRIGDREIFFLRRDAGVLRTFFDTRAGCVEQVLTGAHPDYKPFSGESALQRVIDILLTRGQRCSDRQMAEAVMRFRVYGYDLAYSVRRLRQLAADKAPAVQKAARDKLEELSYSWPKIRDGWPDAEQASQPK